MIGIFDSGLGGMFILKDLKKRLSKESFVYLADKTNFPYGEKSVSVIHNLVKKNINFLVNQKSKQIVIACNTASITLKTKHSYPVPTKGVIEASLKKAKSQSFNKKVGVLATNTTVRSGVFLKKARELNLDLQIYQQACPLARFVEKEIQAFFPKETFSRTQKNTYNKKISPLLKKYLTPLINQEVDTVILGCTHYLYLKSAIQKYLGKNKKVIGPIDFLIKDLRKNKNTFQKKQTTIDIFINGESGNFAKKCRQILGNQNHVTISTVCI